MDSEILNKIAELTEPVIDKMGFDLMKVNVENAGTDDPRKILVIYINKEGGVNMEDVVRVTKSINPLIDKADIIKGSYILSVSSPGE